MFRERRNFAPELKTKVALLGIGAKGDAMFALGVGPGGNIGLSRVYCLSSDVRCDLFVLCGKFIGAGGSAGVTGGATSIVNTKCTEDLENFTIGIDVDLGKAIYASGGANIAPARSISDVGLGFQLEGGLGFGASGGVTLCKAWRISCRGGG